MSIVDNKNKIRIEKRKFFVIISILIVLCCLFSFQTNDNMWVFKRKIILNGINQYKSITLDNHVYKESKSDLSDLRIIDEKGNIIPYYTLILSMIIEKSTNTTYATEKVYNEYKKKENQSIHIFQLKEKQPEDFSITSLELKFTDLKFSTAIQVFGRTDNLDWDLITNDSVYNLDNVSKTKMVFPHSVKYNFYKIVAVETQKHFNIENCILGFSESEEYMFNAKNTVSLQYEMLNDSQKSNITIKNPNKYPIHRLIVKAKGNYQRYYEYINRSENYAYASGTIFNLLTNNILIAENTITINNNPQGAEEYEVVIINNDNNPLQIQSISGEYYLTSLIFEAAPNNEYFLQYGNPNAEKPQYDIDLYKKYIISENKDACILSDFSVNNPILKNEKNERQEKTVFTLLLFIVAVILVIFIYRIMRKKIAA